MKRVQAIEVKVRVENRKMKIPSEILEMHDVYYTRGDYAAISEMCYGSTEYRQKVVRAFTTKECSKELCECIIRFYTEVKKQTEQIMSEYDHND